METIHEGIHEFSFPYVGNYSAGIGNCHVKLIYGEMESINKDSPYGATFIVTQSETVPPLEHFIEVVCSDINRWVEGHLDHRLNVDNIRWIQVLPYYQNGIWKQVTFDFDPKSNSFRNPKWEEMEPLINSLPVIDLTGLMGSTRGKQLFTDFENLEWDGRILSGQDCIVALLTANSPGGITLKSYDRANSIYVALLDRHGHDLVTVDDVNDKGTTWVTTMHGKKIADEIDKLIKQTKPCLD